MSLAIIDLQCINQKYWLWHLLGYFIFIFIGTWHGAPFRDLIKALEIGETYVNVHTEKNPNGEIRGQISAVK